MAALSEKDAQGTAAAKLYLSSSPHMTAGLTTQHIMLCLAITLVPLAAAGVLLFGLHALLILFVSVVSCVVFEALFYKAIRRPVPIKDFSAVITGLLFALTLPPSIPIWMAVLGSAFGIIVAKAFFGGLGANVFNPALCARAFLFISFPQAMGSYTPPFDGVSSATMLAQERLRPLSGGEYLSLFLGNRSGSIGETSAALILLAALILIILKIIDWRAPLAMIAVAVGASALAGQDALSSLFAGGLLFGAVFMATDYATAPITKCGRLIFGAGCGLVTFLIRQFAGIPEGVMYSILFMNILTPFLDRLVSRRLGEQRRRKGRVI